MAFSDNPNAHLTTYLQRTTDGAGALTVAAGLSKEYLMLEIAAGADLPDLTAAEGAESGGTSSWRKVAYELANRLWENYNNMASADRPTKLTVSRSGLSAVSGSATEVERTISFKVRLDASGLDVIAE